MSHPENEPGKSYNVDDRRRAAALTACDGFPTEWLERGFVRELYSFAAVMALADTMSRKEDGYVKTPSEWWREHVRGCMDRLNDIATIRQ